MQPNSRNNFLIICILFVLFIVQAGLIPTNTQAASSLLLLYSNDVRSELEACG